MIPYEKILKEMVDRDDRLMVLTAENRAALRNLAKPIGDRFIDTGTTEQTMIGMAAGLALRGKKPVCHALAAFLTMRAYEFIRTDVGIAQLPVKLAGWVPGILSDANGPTHQAIEDVSIMRGIPGMHVFAPADEDDLIAGLPDVLESESPTYIRLHFTKPVYTHDRSFKIGEAERVDWGKDVCLLTYGPLFEQSFKAAEALRNEGVSVGLVNMRMLSPIDEKTILAAVADHKLVVTVEDHFLRGGLATILAEVCLKHRKAPHTLHLGFDQKWFKPGLLPQVLQHEGLTGDQIAGKVLRKLKEI